MIFRTAFCCFITAAFLLTHCVWGQTQGSIFDDAVLGNVESETPSPTPGPSLPRNLAPPEGSTIKEQKTLLAELVAPPAAGVEADLRRYIDDLNKLLPGAANDPASLYVILDARRTAANASGDPALIVAASAALCDAFAIDPLPVALEAVEPLRGATLPSATVGALIAVSEAAVVRSANDAAHLERLVVALEEIVNRVRDDAMRAYLLHRVSTLRQNARIERAGADALAQIDAGRANPEIYTAAGLYLCVRTAEWDRGTDYLSRGRQGALRDAATREREPMPDALRIADAWWLAAESLEPGGPRDVLRRRAAKAYAVAMPTLRGLKQAQAERRIASAQPPATVTTPAPPKPSTEPGADQTVVYLLDGTGTMLGLKWQLMLEQVEASLEKMPDRTRVGIVFFAETATLHGKAPVPLTAANRKKLLQFIHSHQARGSTNPMPGIEAAFAMKPDTILMLTDGEFDNLVTYDSVIRAIRNRNSGRRVKVNTFMFGDRDPRAEQTLQSIATENNGRMRVVELEKLVREKQK